MISAIIPAYNEEKTIGKIITNTKKYVDKVIVVDDGSTDKTSEIAIKKGAILIKHKRNYGVGRATRDGFKRALSIGSNYIITIDADGQHFPSDIPKFINKLNQGYDFVIGRRNLSRYPFIKRIGNFALNIIINFISGTAIPDTESGFRGYNAKKLKKMYLTADRYEICDEIIFEVGRNKLKWTYVPIKSYVYTKGTNILDGLRILKFMLRRRKRNWKSYFVDLRYVLLHWKKIYKSKGNSKQL